MRRPSHKAHTGESFADPLKAASAVETAASNSRRNGRWIFWSLFVLILLFGAGLRTWRIDVPPIDYPADRQTSTMRIADQLVEGASLWQYRRAWFEIQFLPYLIAKTHWLASAFNIELWTLGRAWSAVAGILTFLLAFLAGSLCVDPTRVTRKRRTTLGLVFMTAIAFNPYHIRVSHMITTESLTLAFQAGAVAIFCAALHDPRRWWKWVGFLVLFFLSVLAKLPSFIWLPAFLIYFLSLRALSWRIRMGALVAFGILMVLVFWVVRLNPFTFVQDYIHTYSSFADQVAAWIDNPIWVSSFVGRVILMLTLPGAVLAGIGLLVAPPLFSITFVWALVCFYFLNNLNTYNFCHLIMPGMALVSFGAIFLAEAPLRPMPWLRRVRPTGPVMHAAARVAGVAVVGCLVFGLYPWGPPDLADDTPRADVLASLEPVRRHLPEQARLTQNDPERAFSYMFSGGHDAFSKRIDLSSGYFFSIDRFGRNPLKIASMGWIAWSSLPGEAGGILVQAEPDDSETSSLHAYVRVRPAPGDQAPRSLSAAYFLLPSDRFDPETRTLNIRGGSSFKLGIAWQRHRDVATACMVWAHRRWRRYVPPPIRTGGAAVGQSALLSLPRSTDGLRFYEFTVPEHFPPGRVVAQWYPVTRDSSGRKADVNPQPFPFTLSILPLTDPPVSPGPVPAAKLYPATYDRHPNAWSEAWWYRNMRLEGYRTRSDMGLFFTTPGMPPGTYRLTVSGEAEPITRADSSRLAWPTIAVYLPGHGETQTATISINRRQTHRFSAEFSAAEPFDALLLDARVRRAAAPFPRWLVNFKPAAYGRQLLTVRSVGLQPLDEAAAPPS